MKSLIVLLAFLLSGSALASGTRTLDGAVITNGAAIITLPTSTIDMSGLTSLTGSNSGDITVQSFGASPSSTGFSLTGQALTLEPADATHSGGLSTADWNTFNNKQAGPLTGDVTTSGAAATLATVNSNVGSFTNANITVNAKGLITAASNGASAAPSLNGGSGSAESVTAAGGVSLTSQSALLNEVWITGSGGAVTVTKTPSITAGSNDGEVLKVIGTSATNTVHLQDQANLASSGLSLNGDWIGGKDSVLTLHWDTTQSVWVEDSRR